MAGPGYSPFIRIAGSDVVYSAPIVATGDGPFDVVHHTNTGDRVLGVHIAPPSPPGPAQLPVPSQIANGRAETVGPDTGPTVLDRRGIDHGSGGEPYERRCRRLAQRL